MNNWTVKVTQPMNMMGYDIYVYRNLDSGHREFITKGGAEAVTVKAAEATTKEIHFARLQDESLAQLLLEALEQQGVQSPAKGFVEGELTATKLHLDDMRRLAFGEPKTYGQEIISKVDERLSDEQS